jgi:hypothetical protein
MPPPHQRGDESSPISFALPLILALPRIARLLYPQVWVEDDFYLQSAWLVSAGFRPYLDFIHPHLPILELAVAPYLKLFGANHLSIEILNEAVIYLTSLLSWRLAASFASRRVASCAAILYAFSSLVFRFHVYERENFIAAIIVGAALIAIDDSPRALIPKGRVALALLLVLACSIKLTAIIPSLVILVWIAAAKRRPSDALACGAGLAAGLTALTAAFYLRYGSEFLLQTLVFHFMKGADTRANLASYPAAILDVLVPLIALGLVRITADRRDLPRRPTLLLVLGLAVANYLFFGFLSPTAWAHNYLDFLPFLAIIAAIGFDGVLAAVIDLVAGSAQSQARPWLWAIGGSGAILLSMLFIAPLVNENWILGSIYGFGFVPRTEISAVAETIRSSAPAGEPIIAPAFLAFEANRPLLIAFPETYGVYRQAKESWHEQGFLRARDLLGRADFFDLIGSTAHWWTDQMKAAILDHRVNVVVPDSQLQTLALVRAPLAPVGDSFLRTNGFSPAIRTEHYTVWTRPPR